MNCSDMPWYTSNDKLFAFAEVYYKAHPDVDIFYLLRKPWKWDTEHKAWTAAGCPEDFIFESGEEEP